MSRPRSVLAALVLMTLVVAAIGARPYAGSWNDGSRLAAAESLVDRGTWTIDDSVFVQPSARATGAPPPYPASDRLLTTRGTLDRLLIDGRFVSDKTPISNLILAAEYWLVQRTTGLVVRDRADRVIYLLTLFSAGVSFVAATAVMFVLAYRKTRTEGIAAGLALTFAFATCAAAYSRHVNAHIMLLAVLTMLMWQFDRAVHQRGDGGSAWTALTSGTLAGLAYRSRLGAGSVDAPCDVRALRLDRAGPPVAGRCRRRSVGDRASRDQLRARAHPRAAEHRDGIPHLAWLAVRHSGHRRIRARDPRSRADVWFRPTHRAPRIHLAQSAAGSRSRSGLASREAAPSAR